MKIFKIIMIILIILASLTLLSKIKLPSFGTDDPQGSGTNEPDSPNDGDIDMNKITFNNETIIF